MFSPHAAARHIRVFFIDLDGTLVNSEGAISLRSREALKTAQSLGYSVVLATGRPANVVEALCEELELVGPYIALNGGVRGDTVTGEITLSGRFEEQAALALCDYLGRHDVLMTIHDAKGWCAAEDNERTRKRVEFLNQEPRQIGYEPKQLDEAIKVMAIGGDEALNAVASGLPSEIAEHIDCFRTTDTYLEFVPKGLNKARAAEALLYSMRLNWSHAAAFGDSGNDRTLLESVNYSFAMANAREDIAKVALYQAPSNDEDGVAAIIEQLIETL
ncbi:Cof-type HAD-IIB family hydrolase [Pseudovibrio exalbescens]|uniref:Cof-type HAD-IIB family hydrolase n=1 Tax=Pseudovibrio exalbescens TaxID=197461 RepID=UPI0023669A06|nr:Cof-type HAD-IIB family hydrolase [Pseudovibrio exalbescens]MDD7911048.1 Cof-type HAD-IIB family hydrolase [Pseudovibrio exalbescens]